MKKLKYIGIVVILLSSFSCSKDFLSRAPLDAISDADYWKTTNDLELYVNQFYTMLPVYPEWGGGYLWDDNNSDNMHPATYNTRLAGLATITSGNSNWSFSRLRSINIMLDQYKKVVGQQSLIDAFVGEAYFFRAYYYYSMLKNYGDVPWIDKPLTPDSQELIGPRTSRSLLVDNMLADLDKAITLLRPRSTATGNRINKEAAILFKSRVALFEGTWEKYHNGTPFGVASGNPTKYLQAAADAAKQLIDLNSVALYSTSKPDVDYGKLFNSDDLNSMTEAILWRKYGVALTQYHNSQRYLSLSGGGTGVTKALVDSYLCTDGQPIASSPLYKGDRSLVNVVTNRDPRLKQLIWVPGDAMQIVSGQVIATFTKSKIDGGGEDRNTTGYQLKKGADATSPGISTPGTSVTANVIFRYAEVLLNYAEAKAELGTITQADIDLSINKLRTRAGMPGLQLISITTDPNWDFPLLSPVINEVRRERRVEFACEGYRFDDLVRWRAHSLIVGKRPKGAWFDQSQFPALVIGKTIYIDSNGYIDYLQVALPSGWNFVPGRDYLTAVPPTEITLNSNLIQNPGW
jgi:starch-binding outer membrane protein, SusD/RagB family